MQRRSESIPSKRGSSLFRLLLPLVPLAIVILLEATRGPSFFDDAFITFRYARNIATGRGFVYNTGDPVLGTTTPLFTVILAFIGIVSGSPSIPSAAFLLAIAFDCATAAVLYRLAKAAFNDIVPAILVPVTWALLPFRLSVAGGGMESSIVTFLVLLSFERLVLARSLAVGSIAASLSILTRPDALIAIAPILALLYIRDHRFALKALGLTVALVAPWAVWATAYFGSPLPNSVMAKGIAHRILPGLAAYFILPFLGTGTIAQYTITPALLVASILGITVIVIGICHTVRDIPGFASLAAFGPLFLGTMAVANAPMFFPWYYYPILPSLLFCITSAPWFLPIPSFALRRGLLALTLGTVLVIPALVIHSSPSWPLSREREVAYRKACSFLQNRASSADVVLAPDIGVLGWCLTDVKILDPVGLVSPHSLVFLQRRPQGPAIPLELVLTERPDYVVALQQYVEPFLTPSAEFALRYKIAWSEPVTIAGQTQDLLVYTTVMDPDA